MVSRRTVVLGLATLAALPARAQGQTLRIGVEGKYPPFNELGADGKLKGLDIDIARALCERLKADCRFVVRNWDSLQDSVIGKNNLLGTEYDAIISSMSITPSRRQTADFTQKYYQSPARFMKLKSTRIEATKAGLTGRRIGVQKGTTHDSFVSATFGTSAEIERFATLPAAVDALLKGKIDALMADTMALYGSALKGKDAKKLELFGPSFTDSGFFGYGAGIPVKKGNTALRDQLDRALTQIRADGTHEAILKRYFDFDLYGQ